MMASKENNMTQILLLEDNRGDIELLEALLGQETYFKKKIEICDNLLDGVYKLCTQPFDIVLLDLNLTDSRGEETFDRVYALSQQVPIVVFTGLDDHEFGLKLVKKGAQDFLIKGQLDGASMVRTIIYAIERKQLMSSLQKLSKALEQSPVSVAITDIDGKIEYVNERFNREAGSRADELIGRNPRFEKAGYFAQAQNQEIWEIIAAGQQWQGELHIKNNGHELWENVSVTPVLGSNEKVANYLVIKEDITVRKKYEEQLFQKNNFDTLTGLPNRHLASDRLNQLLGAGNDQDRRLALIFIGLRNFHAVNDSYGHAVGDQLLVEIAARLKRTLNADDTLARFGGDEFLIIVQERSEENMNTERCVAKALECIETPFVIDGKEIIARGCLGISLYPSDGKEAQTLLNNAYVAMNHCKREPVGRSLRYFQSDMNEAALKRIVMDSRLRVAIQNKELSLVYQPQVDVKSNALIGAEALLRWHNKDLGTVAPDVFIPIAEESDLILKIGAWVLKEACAQFKQWQESSGKDLKVSVNISTRQLMEERHFIKLVSETLSETSLAARSLELEITEHTLVDESRKAEGVIRHLKGMGVEFAVDDFGVGYSSLSYIKDFPLKCVKIDRSFLRRVPASTPDNNLVKAIIAMGHGLGLCVIAEGIETQEQLDFIRSHDCDMYQGYFFAKPLSAQDFEEKYLRGSKS